MHIVVPKTVENAKSAKLPVVIFLHGGDYSYGSASGGGTFGKIRTLFARTIFSVEFISDGDVISMIHHHGSALGQTQNLAPKTQKFKKKDPKPRRF